MGLLMPRLSVDELVEIAVECRELARSIRHRFELNEYKLEAMGYSEEEIDLIFTMWERN